MLYRLKYIQLSHCYVKLGLYKLKSLVKGWKGMNFKLLIKCWQNGSKKEMIHVLRTIGLIKFVRNEEDVP